MRRPLVLCVINSLVGGGAERVFASLLEALVVRAPHIAFDVVLLDDEARAYAMPADVSVTQLDARRSMARSVTALTAHAAMRRPDLLFSFLTRANCAAIIAGGLCGRPVVISERTFTSAHLEGRALQKALVKTFYPAARNVIAVGEASRLDLIRRFGVSPKQVTVIHNPAALATIRTQATAPAPAWPRPYLAAMGRLVPNKNFALLINAFARAELEHDLLILGDGPERHALQSQIDGLGLSTRVRLMGRLDNPFPVLAGAQCLAVASNVEGFPNVIVEALGLGVPVVSTDCDCGPAELLGGDPARKVRALSWARYGALVPPHNMEALAAGLARMCEPGRRALYARRGPERAAVFTTDRAAALYLGVIESALRSRRGVASNLEPAA